MSPSNLPQVSRDRVAVLTFDDGHKSDHATVAPVLQRFGFGATFFITEGLGFLKNKRFYLTWDEIGELHRAGFEIGNHTKSHLSVSDVSQTELAAELEHVERRCAEHAIPRPTTFAYPGYHVSGAAIEVLRARGYVFARRGIDPEVPIRDPRQGEDTAGRGRPRAWEPGVDHPLLVPTTVDAGWYWSAERFRRVITGVPAGTIPVLTFHGVPAIEHPWVTVDPAAFLEFMTILHEEGFRVIPLRELAGLEPDGADRSRSGGRGVELVAALGLRRRVFATGLRCENAHEPIGVGDPHPRLSWVPESSRRGQVQRAAQVLVSGDPDALARGIGDLWDSGRVATDSVGLRYAGATLGSGQRCWWKVRLWDRDGQVSDWSRAASFELGLLDPAGWRGGWVAADHGVSAPLLRTTFRLDGSVHRARAYVLGLGYHELRVNGARADDRVLDPAPSYYDDGLTRDLGMGPRPRTRYATYDVTALLRHGDNCVGVMLGHGFYSAEADVPRSPYHRDPYGDRPVLRIDLRIELDSGQTVAVNSGPDWRTTPGPIGYNDYCHGETYDARHAPQGWDTPAFDDEGWPPVEVVPGPAGLPSAQRTPPARVTETLALHEVGSPGEGRHIFDSGQNLGGWARIRVRGEPGASVTLRHAARLTEVGELDTRCNEAEGNVARQTDSYILRGDAEETWEPRFTIHGFRFVEASMSGTARIEAMDARVVHNDVERIGSFASSEPLLDQIHSNLLWSLRSCLQGSLEAGADRCERLGWLGDPGFLSDSLFYDFDLASFFADWLDDIADAQMPNGQLPVVAPPHWHAPWGRRPNDFAYQPWPDWMSTYPILVWTHYRFYGDESILERHFDGMRRLVDWMSAQAQDLIVPVGLGDHMEPQPDGMSSHSPRNTRIALTSTAWFYESTRIVAASARVLGNHDEAARYGRLANDIRRAFNRRFFDRRTGSYDTGSQTSNALPLWLGMVPPGRERDVLSRIEADIRARDNHLATGIMGTPALVHALPEHGAAATALDVVTQTTYPSWGHQIALGATTLWETWGDDPPGMGLNTWMFGAFPTFLYRDVAGISPAAPGWRHITIRPRVTGQLDSARARVLTPRGEAVVDWRRDATDLRLEIVIPATSTADVILPTGDEWHVALHEGDDEIWRDGQPLRRRPGITRATRGRDHVRLRMGGGTYLFRIRYLPILR